MPPNLAENNLANTHPEWVCAVGDGLYLNPAEPAAADYVVQGVAELLQNYAVDVYKRQAMVFQDPMTSLDPTMPIGKQIMEGMLWHYKMPKDAAYKQAVQLLEEVDVYKRQAMNR